MQRAELADDGCAAGSRWSPRAEGVERAAEECRAIVALAGADVPVVDGGRDAYCPTRADAGARDAVDSLVALAHEDREGPLYVARRSARATNVASALLVDPSIAARVVVVWTSAYPTYWPRPNVSFNLAQDLAAARVLLDSGVPLVYLPGYYVGEQLRVSLPTSSSTSGAAGRSATTCTTCPPRRTGTPGPARRKVIWDLIDVAWVLDGRWVPSELVPTPVLEDGPVVGPPARAAVMREAHGVDRDAVWLDLYAALDRSR